MKKLLLNIRACTVCEAHLPFSPRPILSTHPDAKINIIGHAPGMKVQESGIPWHDKSGEKLRDWLGIDETTFYDPTMISIIPMGFCYPGRGKSGDLPPRHECAPLWHEQLLKKLPNVKLTLLIGQYAQNYYLEDAKKRNLTETVRSYKEYLPDYFPLVHPSPLNFRWQAKNKWFMTEVIPYLRKRVKLLLE